MQKADETRVAAVTGAAQGIGRRVAEVLAERGFRVALTDLHTLHHTLESIQARAGEAVAHTGDIVDESTIDGFVRTTYATWGRTDVLVNNAGISLIAAAGNTPPADLRRVIEVQPGSSVLAGPGLWTKDA